MNFDPKKLKDKWQHRIQHILEDSAYRLAYGIELRGKINVAKAVAYTSNTQAYSVSSRKTKYDGRDCEYEVIFDGPQIAFLEFGTGIYNETFLMGISSQYIPDIVNMARTPDRGGYGRGKGMQYHWAFYRESNVSSLNGDYELTYKTYLRKRDGGLSIYRNSKPIVITTGLKPQRMIYNAIREGLREVRKKK